MDFTSVKDDLIDKGISPSRPRLAILNYLRSHYTHPTADEIFRVLRAEVPTLSLTTVYNTLRLFTEKGLCQSLTINDKQVCFDGKMTPHAHFLCSCCGKIYDVEQSDVEASLFAVPLQICGHHITETHYYFKGICSHCCHDSDSKAKA